MADDIIDQLLSHRGGPDETCAKELCLLCAASSVVLAQQAEIERLRAEVDALRQELYGYPLPPVLPSFPTSTVTEGGNSRHERRWRHG